jgi:HPt (histidine-containing phosphotransfer) domain-containing protein
MSDERGLDTSAIARLRKLGGDKFVGDMIDLFFQYAPQRLAAARDGAQAGDLQAVEKAIHPLKSSAGQIGARRVQDLATQIEKLAVDKQADAIWLLLAQLEESITQVKPLLEGERNPPPP